MIPLPSIPNPLDLAGDIAGGIFGKLFSFLVDDFVGPSVGQVTDGLISFMMVSSKVDLTGDFAGAGDVRVVVLGLSFMTMLGLLFLGVIRGVLAGDPAAVARQAFIDIPRQGFITAGYLSVTQLAIVVVDDVSNMMLTGVGDSIGRIGAAVSVPAGLGGPSILMLIFMILYILAAIFVWAELLIRSAMIYIVAVLAPLGYAAGVSPKGRELSRRTSMTLLAIILSKLGIAMAFRVGSGLVDGGSESGEWVLADAIVGVTAMGLAAFMPFMILKAIPVMEAASVTEGAERAPLRGAGTALGVGQSLLGLAGGVASLAGAGGVAGAGSATPRPGSSGGGPRSGGSGGPPPPPSFGGDTGGTDRAPRLPGGPSLVGSGRTRLAASARGGGVVVHDLQIGPDGRFRVPEAPPPPAGFVAQGGRPAQLGAGPLK